MPPARDPLKILSLMRTEQVEAARREVERLSRDRAGLKATCEQERRALQGVHHEHRAERDREWDRRRCGQASVADLVCWSNYTRGLDDRISRMREAERRARQRLREVDVALGQAQRKLSTAHAERRAVDGRRDLRAAEARLAAERREDSELGEVALFRRGRNA